MIESTTYSMTRNQIERDEGRKNKIYKDSEGILTIGIGRNLESKGLSDNEVNILYDNDLRDAIVDARRLVPNFDKHNPARQGVIINMSFNLGLGRLSKFKKFLAALEVRDYQKAAAEMKDSRWYHQVKDRAVRLCKQMESGQWVGY